MNAVGYDIATMGNHEFDYGMDRFLELAEKAEFPYISANFTHNDELVFDPYIIKEFDGVKVAFVGITTPKTITSSTPKYFQDEAGNFVYGFCQDETGEKLYAAVQSAIDAAREEGATYVVGMGHLGIEAECAPWMSTDVIANTTGMDALLDGHSHSLIEQEAVKNKDGEDVLLAACGTKLQGIGYLRIAQDGTLSTGLYQWNNDVALPELLGLENDVATAVNEAVAALDEKLGEVVAKTAVDLVINDPETDVRIIRNAETTLNDILLVHPFGNAMCVVEATGQQILDALEWGARVVPEENGGFLQVSGLTYEIHTYIESSCTQDENGLFTGVSGEYRVKNVKVNGEDLDLEKTYTLASHNYMLKNAGDGFTMFQNDPILQDEVMLDNQVLINYITGTLEGNVGEAYANPYGDGRIVAVTEAPAE